MRADPETDLTLVRTLRAPRDAVWTCWTTPEHLKAFFVPRPHRVVACEIDLRPGGRFDTTFEVEGQEMRNEGVYLEVVQGRRLVFTDAYSAGWRPAADPFLTAIVDFADAEGGGTLYEVTARHRTAEARARHEEMGFHAGWGTVADQLEAYAATL